MKRGELEPLVPHDCPDRPRCQLCAARRVIEESPRFMETMRKMCQVAAHSEEAVERQAYGWYVEDVPGEVEDE